jgi:Cu+-exporting ATPase
MTCSHCVASVKGAVKAIVDGVDDEGTDDALDDVTDVAVDVELATAPDASILRITTNHFVDPVKLQNAIETAGYGVDGLQWQGKVSIPVTGMHCQSCVNRVSTAVAGITGVDNVVVELDEQLVHVKGAFNWAVLVRDLSRAGYPVRSYREAGGKNTGVENTGDELTDDESGEQKEAPVAVTLDIQGMSCASCVANDIRYD